MGTCVIFYLVNLNVDHASFDNDCDFHRIFSHRDYHGRCKQGHS